MPRVENVPGSAGAPRVPATPAERPALPRDPRTVEAAGDEQAPRAATGRSASTARWLWGLTLIGLAVALAALREVEAPTPALRALATGLGVTLAVGLAVRTGGRPVVLGGLALLVGTVTVATGWSTLLAGAAIATAVLAACLAVLGTRPAHGVRAIVPEVVLAQLVALAGALGAAGFGVGVDPERFRYTVLVLALIATITLVHRLGGGLHGLGRRGLVLCAMALGLLAVVLVYTAALTQYGSPELVDRVRWFQDWASEHLGGVPRPVEVIVGVPALAWGVALRVRRRQGWWACALGVAGTAATASRLVDPGASLSVVALSAAYSVVLGLLVGGLVIRLEHVLTGRERRGTGAPGPDEQRHEPARLQPLH